MPPRTRWKRRSGSVEMVCVAYSGTAANIVSSSISTSRRLAFIPTPDGENNRAAIDDGGQRLGSRLEKCERAEDGQRSLRTLGPQLDARQCQQHLQPAAQRIMNERRRGAD